MRRILLLVTVALVMAAMMVVMAAPAFADQGGIPNAKACQGVVISLLATSNHPEGPFPPPKAAEDLGHDDVKTYIERVREGRTFVVFPNGERFGCPRE